MNYERIYDDFIKYLYKNDIHIFHDNPPECFDDKYKERNIKIIKNYIENGGLNSTSQSKWIEIFTERYSSEEKLTYVQLGELFEISGSRIGQCIKQIETQLFRDKFINIIEIAHNHNINIYDYQLSLFLPAPICTILKRLKIIYAKDLKNIQISRIMKAYGIGAEKYNKIIEFMDKYNIPYVDDRC